MSLHGVAPDRVYSDGRLARRRVRSYRTFPPLPRRRKLHILRFRLAAKAHSFRCSSSSEKNRFAGFFPEWGTRWRCTHCILPNQRGTAPSSWVALMTAKDMELATTGRYISVALFLKSPSAGVTRYPCPVEPGLSSRPAFRPGRATVCLTRLSILAESDGIVNAWPQCGLHIGGSRQGLPLKIPDGPQSAARSRLHGPAALGEKVWEGEGRGCIFFRSAV